MRMGARDPGCCASLVGRFSCRRGFALDEATVVTRSIDPASLDPGSRPGSSGQSGAAVGGPAGDAVDAPFLASFDGLLDALPDGVAIAALDGRILSVNQQLCDLAGIPRDVLVGAPIETLVPARFRAEHVAHRVGYIADGGAMRVMSARPDIVLVRGDGREVPVEVALSTSGHERDHERVPHRRRDGRHVANDHAQGATVAGRGPVGARSSTR